MLNYIALYPNKHENEFNMDFLNSSVGFLKDIQIEKIFRMPFRIVSL